MVKRIASVVVFLLVLIILPNRVFAAEEFATSYDILYDVDESGVTTVTEKITLKNLTSEYFAEQFKLTIGATDVSDVKAYDAGGALATSKEQKDTSTSITVNFNQQVAGMGKTLSWTLQLKSKDFAQKTGKVWEVRTPKISSTANLEFYNLTLAVPQSFGEPSSINPIPKSQTSAQGKLFLTFDIDQLKSSGVFANFGTFQLFDFDLAYHLENSNWMPILTSIALPPDTPFQDVMFQRIDPKPLNVTIDEDSNYLAWYKLNRGQKFDIRVFGSAKLYTNSKVRKFALSETQRNKYTKSDEYWEKDNPQIREKLNEILKENSAADANTKTKLIYKFVVDYLKYDSGRLKDNIERLGAVTALNNPDSAVCMEFTDLFIALARAAGIPARELDGYAYTTNTTLRPLSLTRDILHAWPEYWDDSRGWVMVDPTWENTTGGVDYFNKLDLNHFVFAVKGVSSKEPVPAGSYKYTGQDSHDVKVTLSDKDFLGKAQIDVEIEVADPIIAGFPGKLTVKITNAGSTLYPATSLTVGTNNLTILDSNKGNTGPIPAYGEAEFDFNIRTKSLLDSYSDQIVVLVGEQRFTKNIQIKPFFLLYKVLVIVGGMVALMVAVYLAILGFHLYNRRMLSGAGTLAKKPKSGKIRR